MSKNVKPETPGPIREFALANLTAPPRPAQAQADHQDAREEDEAWDRRRLVLYDNRKTNARRARSS
jgi:hypothetical protein